MVYRSGKGSPHFHGSPVDVVPTTAGIPSTLNPLPRYYREFQSHSRGNTADTAVISQIPLPSHSLLTTWPMSPMHERVLMKQRRWKMQDCEMTDQIQRWKRQQIWMNSHGERCPPPHHVHDAAECRRTYIRINTVRAITITCSTGLDWPLCHCAVANTGAPGHFEIFW